MCLKGKWFIVPESATGEKHNCYSVDCGKIIDKVEDSFYLIRKHFWGDSTHDSYDYDSLKIVSIELMVTWDIYESEIDWNEALYGVPHEE
jgi:hypothetical protein